MDITTLKIDLAQKVLQAEDKEFLEYIDTLFKNHHEEDFWDDMPDEVRASLEIALDQSEKGQTMPHDEVMKKYEKWLKK